MERLVQRLVATASRDEASEVNVAENARLDRMKAELQEQGEQQAAESIRLRTAQMNVGYHLAQEEAAMRAEHILCEKRAWMRAEAAAELSLKKTKEECGQALRRDFKASSGQIQQVIQELQRKTGT